MKLDRLIRILLPREDKFFALFQQDAENLLRAAKLLEELMKTSTQDERRQKIQEIKDAEHAGDDITHKIFSELSSTFVTPIDREDIHFLASALDDIVDHIDGAASRALLYNLEHFPEEMSQLADVIYKSAVELNYAIPLMRDMKNHQAILDVCVKINSYENEADKVFHQAIARIFANCADPIEIIKLKDILVALETATDKCEDAANLLESLVLKHA
jgi:predicted phosphate transport protein (TIGR00153 family)